MNFIAGTISFFVIVPLLTFVLFYILFIKVLKKPNKAFLYAADATTIFFIYAVYALILVIWNVSSGWWIFLFFILTLLTILFLFYRIKEELDFKKSLRLTWRLHFLLYFLSYICLFIYGMVDRVIQGIR